MATKKENKENQEIEVSESTLEEDFAKLEVLLEEMERDDIGIEEAFAKYAEGMQLIKACNARIDRVEKKVKKLSEDLSLTDLDD